MSLSSMKTLGLILARGGSKRLPGKNIKPLLGKPLISWSIEAALNSKFIDKILVSTDSTDIQKVALESGAECPFLRPDFLSSDSATSADAALHALDFAEKIWGPYDAIILLEPTSPLRKSDDLDRGIQILKDSFQEADGVVSLGKIQLENPRYSKEISRGFVKGLEISSEEKEFYFPYGVLYLIKTAVLRETKSFYTDKMLPYFIERWQNYEVDDICDFHCVETIMKLRESGELQ